MIRELKTLSQSAQERITEYYELGEEDRTGKELFSKAYQKFAPKLLFKKNRYGEYTEKLRMSFGNLTKQQIIGLGKTLESFNKVDAFSKIYQLDQEEKFNRAFESIKANGEFEDLNEEDFREMLDLKDMISNMFDEFESDIWVLMNDLVFKQQEMSVREFSSKIVKALRNTKKNEFATRTQYNKALFDNFFKEIDMNKEMKETKKKINSNIKGKAKKKRTTR